MLAVVSAPAGFEEPFLLVQMPGGPIRRPDLEMRHAATATRRVGEDPAQEVPTDPLSAPTLEDGQVVDLQFAVEVPDAGIPHDLQEKIFELYFTTKKGGSGIGLAQTYQALQWHYGSIDFETVEGQGTIFRLRLPAVEFRAEGNGGSGRAVAPSLTVRNS